MPPTDPRLETLEQQMLTDGIEYLLVQFVDIHGAAKVKLVPRASCAHVWSRPGAGFAGGAVWGMGQGPHSHDLCARADPSTYTPLPYETEESLAWHRPSRGRQRSLTRIALE